MRDGSERQKCYRCGEVKAAKEFAWRRKYRGQRDSFCRPCRAEYHREHYVANRSRYVKEAHERKKRLRLTRTRYLLKYFGDHPCSDCGEIDPVVLEFDHVRGEKSFDVGQALPYRSWQSILKEIEKCEVVCANCHRRRTAQRKGTVRMMLSET